MSSRRKEITYIDDAPLTRSRNRKQRETAAYYSISGSGLFVFCFYGLPQEGLATVSSCNKPEISLALDTGTLSVSCGYRLKVHMCVLDTFCASRPLGSLSRVCLSLFVFLSVFCILFFAFTMADGCLWMAGLIKMAARNANYKHFRRDGDACLPASGT